MRWFVPWFAISMLAACDYSADNLPATRPLAGTYQGDHGEMTRIHGFESELILDENGTFRYFSIDSNTAVSTSKGRWSATESKMIWTEFARSNLRHGGFRSWDTADLPDTSFIRKVTESGFERLEPVLDTLYMPMLRWVRYRWIPPEKPLPEGIYEFAETYPDRVDTPSIVDGLTRLEIFRNAPYTQRIFRNGHLYMSEVDTTWSQAGTHLITSGNRHCDYEPGNAICGDAPPGYEYVARLSHVGDTAFSLWMSPDFTFQENPFWAEFRKTSSDSL